MRLGQMFTDKGVAAEEMLAEYFRRAGFFAVRGVPFIHEGEVITDIDVWLYERGGGLERRRYVVDSKNKNRPRVAERLLWTAGLRGALDVDGGFVAATGAREGTRQLARKLGISIIDLQSLGASSHESLHNTQRLAREDFLRLASQLARERNDRRWSSEIDEVQSALLQGFGAGSANVAIRAFKFYASEAITSAKNSPASLQALRLSYFCAAVAAISLDFVAAKGTFQSPEKRKADIENALKYGADPENTQKIINTSFDLVREYLPNGSALANQMRHAVLASFSAVPADMLADIVPKLTGKGAMFDAARALEEAAYLVDLQGFEQISINARSVVGALLDFSSLSRVEFASVLQVVTQTISSLVPPVAYPAQPSLLVEETPQPAISSKPKIKRRAKK